MCGGDDLLVSSSQPSVMAVIDFSDGYAVERLVYTVNYSLLLVLFVYQLIGQRFLKQKVSISGLYGNRLM